MKVDVYIGYTVFDSIELKKKVSSEFWLFSEISLDCEFDLILIKCDGYYKWMDT